MLWLLGFEEFTTVHALFFYLDGRCVIVRSCLVGMLVMHGLYAGIVYAINNNVSFASYCTDTWFSLWVAGSLVIKYYCIIPKM